MSLHDWTRVDAGLFHHFHLCWLATLCDALNAGCLPADYFALMEQRTKPFSPGKRDPQGIHKAIWDEFHEEELQLPSDKPLTLAAYDAGLDGEHVAYVEFVAVGDALPDMPLFLKPEEYVPAPLEETYQATWKVFPAALKGLL